MISIPNVLYPLLTSFCEIGPAQRAELEDLIDYVVLMTAAHAHKVDASLSRIQYMESVIQEMSQWKQDVFKDLLGPRVQD